MPEDLSSQEISEWTRKLNYGTWRYQKNWSPAHVVDAEGCYFIDSSGKRYLDLSSQLMCVNLGHKNQAVIEAIAAQARKLPYIAPSYATDVRVKLSRLLLEVLPADWKSFSSPRRARKPMRPQLRLRACSPAGRKFWRAIAPITDPPWRPSRPLETRVAGPSSRPPKGREASSALR